MIPPMSSITGKVPKEFARAVRGGASFCDALRAVERGRLSSRGRVLREANRRGKWFGILSRAGSPLGRQEARLLAAESADGMDPYRHCAVPARDVRARLRQGRGARGDHRPERERARVGYRRCLSGRRKRGNLIQNA